LKILRLNRMKTLNNKILIGLAALVLSAGLIIGCSDSFLDGPPQGSLDEVTLSNPAGVEANLIASYRVLGGWFAGVGGWGAASSNWPFGSITSDDAYKGSENLDQPDANDLELYLWSLPGAHNYLNDKWRSQWEGVSRTNSTIRLLNTVLANDPGAMGPVQANGIRGEALFLRAHYHFEAWKIWGNVPYYKEDDTDFRKSNVGVDVIANVLADLDEAINLLPDTPRNGEVGRVTRWTARAYKGRVQAYTNDWQGALTTLREVRNSGPYALEQNYHRVWTGFAEFANGPETILAFQASANDGNPEGDNANWGERLNFPHGGSPFGCCGFHQPSHNLVNFFRTDANGLPLPLTQPNNWNTIGTNLTAEVSADLPLDPRLDWTVGRDGVPYKDWGAHASGWIRDPSFGGPYSPKKNVHEQASGAESAVGWVPTQLNSVNLHLYRYADMLLLLAEAEVEVGSLENAREIVNQIRARAAAGAQGPGTDAGSISVPIDHPSITWADYRVGLYEQPWANQATAREAVRIERRLELAMEGHRYFDLRRWGQLQDVLNSYVQTERARIPNLQSAGSLENRHQWYPIPNIQIQLSRVDGQDRLVQNDGW
jgi:hypothetical protein